MLTGEQQAVLPTCLRAALLSAAGFLLGSASFPTAAGHSAAAAFGFWLPVPLASKLQEHIACCISACGALGTAECALR